MVSVHQVVAFREQKGKWLVRRRACSTSVCRRACTECILKMHHWENMATNGWRTWRGVCKMTCPKGQGNRSERCRLERECSAAPRMALMKMLEAQRWPAQRDIWLGESVSSICLHSACVLLDPTVTADWMWPVSCWSPFSLCRQKLEVGEELLEWPDWVPKA